MSRSRSRVVSQGRKRGMLRPLVVVAAGLLLVLAAFLTLRRPSSGVAIEAQGAPRLKADRQEINLGDVRLGTTVEAAFELSNVGDQPLRFSEPPYIEVREGC